LAAALVAAGRHPVIPDSSCQIETNQVILPFLSKEIEQFQTIFRSKISTVLGPGEQLFVNIVGGYTDDCAKFMQHHCETQYQKVRTLKVPLPASVRFEWLFPVYKLLVIDYSCY
jgi:hypothetical protein